MTSAFKPLRLTPHLYQLGTPFFPMYLSVGEEAMLIEGGISATFPIVVDQLKSLGIEPERVRHVALTHTHTDHIGALPRLRMLWPHLQCLGSSLATKTLANPKLVKQFQSVDNAISKIMQEKGEIDRLPENLEVYNFTVDRTIVAGERIELGDGIAWTMHAIPGHSACQHAFFEEGEKVLAIGDATGFYNPQLQQFWPNYFESLPQYVDSIKKLAGLGAERIILSHNGCIASDISGFFAAALRATGAYHHEMIERVGKGEKAEDIAQEKAKWVYSIADHMPFMIMTFLCQVLISQSIAQQEKGPLTFEL